MNKLKDMRIGKRLGIGFGVLLALSIIIAAIGVINVRNLAKASLEIIAVPVAKERIISDWSKVVNVSVTRTIAIAKSTDPALAVFFKRDADASSSEASALSKRIEPLLVTQREKDLFQKLSGIRKEYVAARDEIMKLKADARAEEAAIVLEQRFIPVANRFRDAAGELLAIQRTSLDGKAAEINSIAESSQIRMILLSVLLIGFGIFCGLMLTRSITNPLQRAVGAARRVANGDLTGVIEVTSKDEAGELLQALKEMNGSLLHIVSQVRAGTQTIAIASGEMASGNFDLSSRTEQQAGSLEETASAMEQLTSAVRQSADNASEANELAIAAARVATKGGEEVSKVVDTIASINDASRKVTEIISVIDEMAFQTNILALNAAVEAARAGEQGRGFAVVATEVRSLAGRSAAAAREIKGLIDDSVSRVAHGTELVACAGKTMEEVVSSIRRVTEIVAQITASSREQSAGIEQVNLAIAQMDQMTQQNAALVEEAAAASQSMHEQSQQLSESISKFSLSDAERAASSV